MVKIYNGMGLVVLGLSIAAPAAPGASVILNEYNAVGSTRHLDEDAVTGDPNSYSKPDVIWDPFGRGS